MKTTQLQNALKLHRDIGYLFKGMFASTKYTPQGKTVALLANTDLSHKPGQHWWHFSIPKHMSTSLTPMAHPLARLPFTDL